MPLSDHDYSERVMEILETIKRFLFRVAAERTYFGVVLDDSMADPQIVRYLSDPETGVLSLHGELSQSYLDSPDGARLTTHYRSKGFYGELSPGMKLYMVCISKIDKIAVAAREGDINPTLGMEV